ncbi:MAG: hypothetical protein H6738_16430 [Alphaproteobacteria bacterium]|nr:hypothetical protein [Alphaproteobacteria bacterium]MCB9698368.1 hypothetical protein [Alphaproteobacteria bacterium]
MTPEQLAAIRAHLEGTAELARVDRAIEDGTYGTCARCGEELDGEQLVARPLLGLCPDCLGGLAAEQGGRRFGICGVRPRR